MIQTEKQETLEHKILHLTLARHDCFKRSEFITLVSKYYGDEGKQMAIDLWNKGCFGFNNFGYVVLTKRGLVLYDTGVLIPKRTPRPKVTVAQYLDYFWKTNRAEFELWLRENKSKVEK